MRVTLIIPSLDAGGSERVMTTMANYWTTKGWDITLLTLDDGRQPPFYELAPSVEHIALGVAVPSAHWLIRIWNNVQRLRIIRQAIVRSSPDVVISFLHRTNVMTLLATRGLQVPVVVSERNDPRGKFPGRVWDTLRNWTYPWASQVVVMVANMVEAFSPRIQRLCQVIPNPVHLSHELAGRMYSGTKKDEQIVIAMGSLQEQKGFDRLLKAFAQVAPKHPGWVLEIWGEGPLRQSLELLCDAYGLHERVRLPGRTKQPLMQFRRADLFVLSSQFEGFPNVLCEAMACGLPAISFDCASGPGDIIRHGVDGILVPPGNVEQLAKAMDWLMRDAAVRKCLAARAPAVRERFALDKVMRMWDQVLVDAMEQATQPRAGVLMRIHVS